LIVPKAVRTVLPNPIKGDKGQWYFSFADFFCPPDCPEPEKMCTFTQRPRPGNLYSVLARVPSGRFTSVVVRSRQISAGIGGYSPQDLFHALVQIKNASGPVLLSTACRCHGVMHAFSAQTKHAAI
jgi:hypothetical protein